MKKKLQAGLIVSIIILSTNVFSQTNVTGPGQINNSKKSTRTYFDLMVNVVSTSLNYGGSNSALCDFKKSLNGLQAGASFEAGVTPGFSLVSELYFMRKGGILKANNPLSGDESSLRLNTIELPVLARFYLGRFYMNAGPSAAYNLSGKNKIGGLSSKLSFENFHKGFKRFDAGIQMGGGVEFLVKQKRIALDLRYSYGLTNIAYDKEIHNRAVMISVHFSKPWKSNPLGIK